MQQDTPASNIESQLSAIRNNDENALKLLYKANYPKIERYVIGNNGTAEEAKDIFQDAFVAVWRNIQLGKFEAQQEGSLEAYLFRISKNKWLDHLRFSKRMQKVPLTEEVNEVQESDLKAEEEQLLIKKIKQNFRLLGELCRDVLERFYYHRQSMRVIAKELNWTEATARNNKYRCLQQLRKSINSNSTNSE
jgi:RNA polymerase sigma factor (sigma-70 family)